MVDFEIIVIGKGLVGTAAAKYLSKGGRKVAIIGPDEPAENEASLVYASHYDQARVQRLVGKDEVWTRLNVDAVQQYASIQKESGIQFHHGVGCLYINPYGMDEYLQNFPSLAQRFNVRYTPYELLKEKDSNFSGLILPEMATGVYESSPSGYLDPRLLIKAQLEVFTQKGGLFFTDTVISLSTNNNGVFILTTSTGHTYSCAKVLVATGSFVNYFDILPQKLSLITKSEVILLVKIEEALLPEYSLLPALLYEIDEGETEGIYLIPPVKYPDGNFYLKIGCNSPRDYFFDDVAKIQDWFRKGNSEVYAPALIKAIQKLLPSLSTENVLTKKCVISRTATGRPYIGETSVSGLFVAGGCNGYSAMCSDAIGHVAEQLILSGNIPEPYPQNAFEITYVK